MSRYGYWDGDDKYWDSDNNFLRGVPIWTAKADCSSSAVYIPKKASELIGGDLDLETKATNCKAYIEIKEEPSVGIVCDSKEEKTANIRMSTRILKLVDKNNI